ncbi:hypothetical protein BKA82DRAFT_26396 [Pisolithus tinctorius]|uniref:Zinc finger RING-type eukaryotic domain-containing protein n=1 Tax=Pisolithus tinctorius Marx 270 TaxID=870435 RepID=A0A0C3NTF8_PISTI|nr:hypothetical protein BKA82DRAFT_26396 [Pisolithus tinctorius]KIO04185.1 hypothetical protein M404DRAFT_26396 [Pisolithus tinctorius Marx 270]
MPATCPSPTHNLHTSPYSLRPRTAPPASLRQAFLLTPPSLTRKCCRKSSNELTEACQEVERLTAEVNKAKASIGETQENLDHLKRVVNQKHGTQVSPLHDTMQQPFTLGKCGHTFSHTCLQSWFQQSIANAMRNYGNITIPEYLKNPPYSVGDINTIFMCKYISYVFYTCPVCRTHITDKPTETRTLQELIEGINSTFGSPEEPTNDNSIQFLQDIWADCWFDKCELITIDD